MKHSIISIGVNSIMLTVINILSLLLGFQAYLSLSKNQIGIQIPFTTVSCLVAFSLWQRFLSHRISGTRILAQDSRQWAYIFILSFIWVPLFFSPIHYFLLSHERLAFPMQRSSIVAKVFLIWLFQIPVNSLSIAGAIHHKRFFVAIKKCSVVLLHDAFALCKRFPRVTALMIGLCFCLLILISIELGFYFLNRYTAKEYPQKRYTLSSGEQYFERDENLGYKPKASIQAHYRSELANRTIYDALYSIDSVHRRKTPSQTQTKKTLFAIFFGCSFTFGEGVQDDETFPFYFSQFLPLYHPYNYGFHGYGPQQMLARLREDAFPEQIEETHGIAIYLYLPEVHERRAIGSMDIYNLWGRSMPFYTKDDRNRLVRKSNFDSGRPFLSGIYRLLAWSQILKYFNINFPISLNSKHYALSARIISESRDRYQSLFQNGNFFVVIYPNHLAEKPILPYLQSSGVQWLDYSELFDPEASEYKIQHDGHPSARAYKILAEQLSRDLVLRQGFIE